MSFDEVWSQVEGLPDTAIKQVPGVLSESTKNRLSKIRPEEVSAIVATAIDAINHGSVEPLNTLINRELN